MSRARRIVVATSVAPGSPRAHAINVFKTAGGFRRLGYEVTVLCRGAAGKSAAWSEAAGASMYGEPDLRWAFAPETIAEDQTHQLAAWIAGEAARLGPDLVYARHFLAGLRCAEAGLAAVVETHAHIGDTNPELTATIRATASDRDPLAAIITISQRLAAHYAERGADPRRVHVVPDGVDLELFRRPAELRASPFAGEPGPHIAYAGHLYDYKGIPTILAAANRLPHATFHLIGGLPDDIARVRAACDAGAHQNVRLHGPRPHADVPPYLWWADALLLPPSAHHPSAAWTSPVKLGEYLAAGPPIIASDIPALRDWVGEPEVAWFTPDDPAELAIAIEKALRESPEQAAPRLAAAMRLAERYSYPRRAESILRAAGLLCPEIADPLRPQRGD